MNSTLTANARLWQLISPALPVGAYAYSAGLEYAVEAGWVDSEEKANDWIIGQLQNNLSTLDVPVLVRLYDSWQENDSGKAEYWSRFLLASRESSELLAEDRQIGNALAQLLPELDIEEALTWRSGTITSFAAMFALGASRWEIPKEETVQGYLWAWCENQVAAAIKLIPLGQTAGQRILSNVVTVLPVAVERGLQLADEDIGAVSPGVAMACAKHETQYTRLFRS
ncbi:urease accessory protein UreF [Kaarinaea lacus]